MKLSPNFSLHEFVSPNDHMPPSEGHMQNLKALCELALEPLRMALGRPLKVTSGYRSPVYNKSIGGAPGSQHCAGIAADIAVGNGDAMIVAAALASRIPNIGGIGVYPGRGFIHVDIRPRIGGKPTWWLREPNGKYRQLNLAEKAKLKLRGAKL